MSDGTCLLCGAEIEQRRRGRPSQYCCPDHAHIGYAMTNLQGHLLEYLPTASMESLRAIRSQLWQIANQRGLTRKD